MLVKSVQLGHDVARCPVLVHQVQLVPRYATPPSFGPIGPTIGHDVATLSGVLHPPGHLGHYVFQPFASSAALGSLAGPRVCLAGFRHSYDGGFGHPGLRHGLSQRGPSVHQFQGPLAVSVTVQSTRSQGLSPPALPAPWNRRARVRPVPLFRSLVINSYDKTI